MRVNRIDFHFSKNDGIKLDFENFTDDEFKDKRTCNPSFL